MPARSFLLILAFLVSMPALSQVEPDATGGAPAAADDTQMMTPPPVSDMPYASTAGSEARSNYLSANLTVAPSYIDNVLPNTTATPVGDFIYSIFPSLTFDRSTPRQKEQFTYSPTFTFYDPTSSLNAIDQSAALALQLRLTPEVAVSLQDSFSRTSNVYNEASLFSTPVTGSTQTPTPAVIAPFVEQMANTTDGVLSYQFARNAMIGGGGSYTIFDLPNAAEAPDLYNSNTAGGEVFYSRRFSRMQYLGLAYQYARTVVSPVSAQSETQTHALLPFYTLYFNRAFSMSISAGIQHVDVTESQLPTVNSWAPSAAASIGWQGNRGNIAVSYSRTITSGGGLIGAFNSNSVRGSGSWELTRTWTGELSGSYQSISNVAPLLASSYQGETPFSEIAP
jgi:hypothetical protein